MHSRANSAEAGFGSAAAVSLVDARKKAAEYGSMLDNDMLAAKQDAKAAEGRRRTFGECASELIAAKSSEWRSGIHARQWRMTIDEYCKPLLDLPVDADTQAVLSVLKPLWSKIPESARRVRGRIAAVLDYAKAHELRTGENPAAWRGYLALILSKRPKLSIKHHAAVPYRDIPAFTAKLRERDSIPSLALEFTILTAARGGEVLGARWSEIDLESKTWTIPAARMKAAIEHRIPLSARAIEIVERMASIRTCDFIFPGHRRGQGLGQTAMWRLCSGAGTVHGFRSCFRDWVGEETSYPRELAEQALAHATGNAVELAFRGGEEAARRRHGARSDLGRGEGSAP
jgi:integrase